MKRLILLSLIGIFLFLTIVSAEQVTKPTQQYNKIFLNPFYRTSMSSNTNYTYNITVNPPDGITVVDSAIITFEIWITPTVSFDLWVNNQRCNTPTYLVHTTYADAGLGQIHFDCSNVITQPGIYNVTLLPTQANTGAGTGWLDLTYMNNPSGSANIFGTEYTVGDRARVFLQVRDSQGFPENNADCFLKAYYPSRINSSADIYINNAPFLHLDGSDGIYYYDINQIPNETGVYMLSASCSYQLLSSYVYYLNGDGYSPTRYNSTGTYSASTILLNGYGDYAYTSCYGSGGATKTCQAIYDFDTTVHFTNTTNVTTLDLYYMGETSLTGAVLHFDVWNYNNSTWYPLPNNLSFSGLAKSGAPTGLNDFISNSIPVNLTNFSAISSNGTITIRATTMAGSSFYNYNNWLNIKLTTTSGSIQDLKGSGELHVSNLPSATANETWSYNGTMGGNVSDQLANITWSYNRTIAQNITEQITNSTWSYNGTINENIIGQFVNSTWNYSNRSLTYTENIAQDVMNHVWNYNGTITPNIIQQVVNATWAYTGEINSQILNQVSENVWNWSGGISTVITDTVSGAVWNYSIRNLTWENDTTNYTKINEEVPIYTWNYSERNLTLYNDTTNYTKINEEVPVYVWNYTSRNVTVDTSNISQEVWNYYNRSVNTTLTQEVYENVSAYVWNETNRSLTYTDNIGSGIAAQVWSYNGTITPNIIQSIVNNTWSYVARYTHGVILD